MPGSDTRLLGVALVLGGALCFSLVGVLVRLVDDAGVWQVILYRSLTFAGLVAAVLAIRHRGRFFAAFREMGWLGVVGTLGLATGSVCYVWAFFHTTVANAVFLFGALPFITGFIAWAWFGERLRLASWIAMTAALGGIVVMVYDGLVSGLWFGNLLAVCGVFGYAAMTVAVRMGRHVDMMPLLCGGGVLGAIGALLLGGAADIGWHDLALSCLIGLDVGVGFMLFTLGARYVRTGELSLISNAEIMLGPLWVWLVVAEVPSQLTLLGGGIVVAAILFQATMTARSTAPA